MPLVLNLKRDFQMRRSSRTQTTLLVKGVGMVEVVTLLGLSRIIGKSRSSILRYEKTGVFPEAPIMVRSVRYYPLTLAKRLIPLVNIIPPHRKPYAELICEINKVFKEEREKLCPK